jgi:hypothetical protein
MRSYTGRLLALVVVTVIVAAGTASGFGVHQKDRIGLSTSLQNDQLDIMVPLWFQNGPVLVPSVSLAKESGKFVDYGIGFMARINLMSGDAVPYVGVRFGMIDREYSHGGMTNDYYYGPVGGGEYFLSQHFSLSVEADLGRLLVADDASIPFSIAPSRSATGR